MNSITYHPQLLRFSEAAARLRVSRRTLERLIAAGTFPRPVKIGRCSLVRAADIEAVESGVDTAKNETQKQQAALRKS